MVLGDTEIGESWGEVHVTIRARRGGVGGGGSKKLGGSVNCCGRIPEPLQPRKRQRLRLQVREHLRLDIDRGKIGISLNGCRHYFVTPDSMSSPGANRRYASTILQATGSETLTS